MKRNNKIIEYKAFCWPMALTADPMIRWVLWPCWDRWALYCVLLNPTWNIVDWAERIVRKRSQQCQGWHPGLCLAGPRLCYYTFALISFCGDLILLLGGRMGPSDGVPCLGDWCCCSDNWSKFGVVRWEVRYLSAWRSPVDNEWELSWPTLSIPHQTLIVETCSTAHRNKSHSVQLLSGNLHNEGIHLFLIQFPVR